MENAKSEARVRAVAGTLVRPACLSHADFVGSRPRGSWTGENGPWRVRQGPVFYSSSMYSSIAALASAMLATLPAR